MSFADSFPKLQGLIREQMILDGHRQSTANWEALMREQWGDKFTPPRDDMIQVDSPNTTNHYHTGERPQSLGALAKIALAFAISGPVGAGIALAPLVLNAMKPASTTPAPQPRIPASLDNAYDLRLGRP